MWRLFQPATVGDLCKKLYLDNGTVTPLLKKLEECSRSAGRGAQKMKESMITLTEEGRALKEEAANIPLQVGSCVHLSPEEGAMLHSLLYKILETV